MMTECICHRWIGTPGKAGTCPVHGYVEATDNLTATPEGEAGPADWLLTAAMRQRVTLDADAAADLVGEMASWSTPVLVIRADPDALAADLALAEAVRALGESWLVDHSAPEHGIDVRVWTYDEANGDTEHRGSGATLEAAITAALEGKSDD